MYYVLKGRDEYNKYIYTGETWFKIDSDPLGSYELSYEFSGYHRLLTNEELDSFMKIVRTIGGRALSKYWRNLFSIQDHNLSLRSMIRDVALLDIRYDRNMGIKSGIHSKTLLDTIY